MNLQNTLIGFGGLLTPGGLVQQLPDALHRRTGAIVPFVDDYWGGGELVYARASAAQTPFNCSRVLTTQTTGIMIDGSPYEGILFDMSLSTNTANLGGMAAFALNTMAVHDIGWFLLSGFGMPVKTAAAVTADAPGYTTSTSGVITSTQANGLQLLNFRFATTGSGTVSLPCQGHIGSNRLIVQGNDWRQLHLGLTATATGIPASTTIVGFESDMRGIILSAVLTAPLNGNVTFGPGTFTYPLAVFNRPGFQGTTS